MRQMATVTAAIIAACLCKVAPAVAESEPNSVPMERHDRATYKVSSLVDGEIAIDFIVDSSLPYVVIPPDVVDALARTGAVQPTDFLGRRTYILANGSRIPTQIFRIRSLKIGTVVLENIIGTVGKGMDIPLLGQSFLDRFQSWSIDNRNHRLVLGELATPLVSEVGDNPKPPAADANPHAVDPKLIEISYWNTIQNSTDPADFQSYLTQYPNGSFTSLATNRIAALQRSASQQALAEQQAATAASTALPARGSESKPVDPNAVEVAFWQSIENSTDVGYFQDYLQRYPNGSFASLAQRKIDHLQKPTTPPAQPPQQVAILTPPASIGREDTDSNTVPAVYHGAQPLAPDALKNGIEFQCPNPGMMVKISNGKQQKYFDGSQENRYQCPYIEQSGDSSLQLYGIFSRTANNVDKYYNELWPLREKDNLSFRESSAPTPGHSFSYVDVNVSVRGIENIKTEAGDFPSIEIDVRRKTRDTLSGQGGMGSNSNSETLSRYWYCPDLHVTVKHDYKIISGMYGVIGDDQEPWEAVAIILPKS